MLTTGEAAQLLGVTAQTVINWVESGRISAVRVGRGRRSILESSLRLLIEQNRIPAESNAPELWERVRGTETPESTAPAAFASDTADRIVLWNPAIERLLGWTAAERMGAPLTVVKAHVPGLPVDLAELAHEPGEETRLTLLLEFVRRDGTRHPQMTTLSWIRDAQGRSVGTAFVLEPAPEPIQPAAPVPRKASRPRARQG